MIIKNIKINSFGKLNNYSLDLSNGLNVIYGPNEYGKTTIMEFIKIMLYSRNEKTSTGKFVREKYNPWNGFKMSGSITFEHSGQIYKIQKEISDKYARNDKTIVQNVSVGEIIALGKDEEAGEYFLGLDVKSFERSAYIKNLGGADFEKPKSLKNSKDTLADKMFSNLLEGGEEDVSQSGVIAKVRDAMQVLKTPTGRGEIRKLDDKISDLELKINDLNNFEKSQEDIKRKLENLSELIREQKTLEMKIKKFEEYERIKEIEKLLEMVSEKENIHQKADDFGVDLDAAEKLFNTLEKYKKELNEIDIKIENIKKLSENCEKNLAKISEEEKNRFEMALKRFEHEKSKNEALKFFTAGNLSDYKLSWLDFSETLKNIDSGLKEAERMKALKTTELEKSQIRANKINNNFIFAYGIFFICSFIFILANLLGFFPFVFGSFFFTLLVHLYYFYKNKKSFKVLRNEISETDHEINCLKSDFMLEVRNIKSESESNLRSAEKEIKDLLSEKMCCNKMEFYQNYAKSQELKNFEIALQDSEDERRKILDDLKKFLDSTGTKINLDNFYEKINYLNDLKSKYIGISDRIKYKSSAINIKKTDLQSLKNILKDYHYFEHGAESFEIDSLRLRHTELCKMNLHGDYIEMQKKIINKSESSEELSAYAEKLRLQKRNMEEYYECLKISLGTFEEVSDEFRKNFNPKLNGRASEIFKELTGGKYHSLHLQKNYDLIIAGEAADRYLYYFSSGTIDQAYLSSRIAISELISSSKIPLIFDDTLTRYDDERLKNTIKFLKNYSQKNGVQSIIFTCHDYLKNAITAADRL